MGMAVSRSEAPGCPCTHSGDLCVHENSPGPGKKSQRSGREPQDWSPEGPAWASGAEPLDQSSRSRAHRDGEGGLLHVWMVNLLVSLMGAVAA